MSEALKKLGLTLAAAVVAAFGTALGTWASGCILAKLPPEPAPKISRKKGKR